MTWFCVCADARCRVETGAITVGAYDYRSSGRWETNSRGNKLVGVEVPRSGRSVAWTVALRTCVTYT